MLATQKAFGPPALTRLPVWTLCLCGAAIVVVAISNAAGQGGRVQDDVDDAYVGNDACAPCHRAIYDSYAQTAMARTSGPAAPNLIEGTFLHRDSGVLYKIVQTAEGPTLDYSRPGDADLRGSERLKYSVGSNTRGRTYLFDIEGFLYQSPVNYYSERRRWDMSPGYQQLRRMELNHPVDQSCLFCHATRVQPTMPGTLNQFSGEAFLQPGVGCERCHGPGARHVRQKGPILNPARLTGERRDSICMQCHLEGLSRIPKAGRSLGDYRPGDRLADYVSTFVLAGAGSQARGAVSHVESLDVSACKRASADSMSCLTCHDAHQQVGAWERTEHYRRKCLACHASMAEGHRPVQPDCTACHMPRILSADVAHTVVTDHRIPRIPSPGDPLPGAADIRLVEFGSDRPGARELGLAYAEISPRGGDFGRRETLRLLEHALEQRPTDPEVLERLAFVHQTRGMPERAETLYKRALAAESSRAVAATNLGVILAKRGKVREAVQLWAPAFERNPQFSEMGVNLAAGLCISGERTAAVDVLNRVLRHNPDYEVARKMRGSVQRESACEISPPGP